MPPPGSTVPARLTVIVRDLVWDFAYAPIAVGIGFAAETGEAATMEDLRGSLQSAWILGSWWTAAASAAIDNVSLELAR